MNLAILDNRLDKHFGREAANLRKLRTEVLRKEAAKLTAHNNDASSIAVAAKVPSHIIRCKSKNCNVKKLAQTSVDGVEDHQCEDHRPIRDTKLYSRSNLKKGERDKIVTIGNRLKKIMRKIPPGIGMGEPPVAIAERPGRIPDKRGAIFSHAARDLRYQKKTAMAMNKNEKDENWYTEATDCLTARSSGITPTWE